MGEGARPRLGEAKSVEHSGIVFHTHVCHDVLMIGTSVRSIPKGEVHADKQAVISQLRSRLPGVPQWSAPVPAVTTLCEGVELKRRSMSIINDCPALVVELAARISAGGGWVVLIACPDLNLANVAERGRLDRIVWIPNPGSITAAVQLFVESADLIVCGGFDAHPAAIRALRSKINSKDSSAAVMFIDSHVSHTAHGMRKASAFGMGSMDLEIDAHVQHLHGLGQGMGRIRGVDIAISAQTRSGHKHRGVITVGEQDRRAIINMHSARHTQEEDYAYGSAVVS